MHTPITSGETRPQCHADRLADRNQACQAVVAGMALAQAARVRSSAPQRGFAQHCQEHYHMMSPSRNQAEHCTRRGSINNSGMQWLSFFHDSLCLTPSTQVLHTQLSERSTDAPWHGREPHAARKLARCLVPVPAMHFRVCCQGRHQRISLCHRHRSPEVQCLHRRCAFLATLHVSNCVQAHRPFHADDMPPQTEMSRCRRQCHSKVIAIVFSC